VLAHTQFAAAAALHGWPAPGKAAHRLQFFIIRKDDDPVIF